MHSLIQSYRFLKPNQYYPPQSPRKSLTPSPNHDFSTARWTYPVAATTRRSASPPHRRGSFGAAARAPWRRPPGGRRADRAPRRASNLGASQRNSHGCHGLETKLIISDRIDDPKEPCGFREKCDKQTHITWNSPTRMGYNGFQPPPENHKGFFRAHWISTTTDSRVNLNHRWDATLVGVLISSWPHDPLS